VGLVQNLCCFTHWCHVLLVAGTKLTKILTQGKLNAKGNIQPIAGNVTSANFKENVFSGWDFVQPISENVSSSKFTFTFMVTFIVPVFVTGRYKPTFSIFVPSWYKNWNNKCHGHNKRHGHNKCKQCKSKFRRSPGTHSMIGSWVWHYMSPRED